VPVDLSHEGASVRGVLEAATVAETRLGVPRDLVLALAWYETGFGAWGDSGEAMQEAYEDHADHAHVPPTVGIAAIRPWVHAAALNRAALALDLDAETIAREPALGLLAAAWILRERALAAGDLPPSDDPGAWYPILGDYAGLEGPAERADYAHRVLDVVREGLDVTASNGEPVRLAPRRLELPAIIAGARAYHHAEYTGAHWVPARSTHYRTGRGGSSVTHIIIHTMQGSYAGSISWFQSAENPYLTSAHYLIRSSDGDITQMVHESDTAHHIGGWNPFTIGIEHEGWIADPGRWYTETMYRSSARLTRHLCDKYGVPIDRERIVGHVEVPGASHTDPGPGWDWDRYMTYVREAGGPPFEASFVALDYPMELTAGEEGVAWIELKNEGSATWTVSSTRLGTAAPQDRPSPFYADYNWDNDHRPTAPDGTFAPGSVGRFSFVVLAPEVTAPEDYVETFQLVDGADWFGPEVELTIRVVPREGETDGGGPDMPALDGGVVAIDAGVRADAMAPVDEPAVIGGQISGGCSCASSDPRGGDLLPWLALFGAVWLRRRSRRRHRAGADAAHNRRGA
jgi:MYXO-CTERM domain-containing protein